jgi:hypothetical protein
MAKTRIRFDLDVIPASVIAGQWYCEKAVDLSYRYRDIEISSPEIDFGTDAHEEAASGAKILSEEAEIKKLIKSGKPITLVETPFTGSFKGVTIKGYPDYVDIKQGKALLLLDYKFSKHRRVFASQRIQVDTYGFLLNKNHLDTESLVCGIVIISPELSGVDQTDLIALETRKIASEMRRKKWERVDLQGDADIYGELYAFSLSMAKRNLSWAMDYWTIKRAPKRTTKAFKCEACLFNAAGKCRVALTRPKRSWRDGSGAKKHG